MDTMGHARTARAGYHARSSATLAIRVADLPAEAGEVLSTQTSWIVGHSELKAQALFRSAQLLLAGSNP
jgi:hypothetical protein